MTDTGPQERQAPPPTPVVRRGGPDDVDAAARLVAAALSDSPIGPWLAPDRARRHAAITGHVRIWVQHALSHGRLDLVDGARAGGAAAAPVAVAVWFDQTAAAIPVPDDYDARLAAACRTYTDRFHDLDAALDTHHPHQLPHHHLAAVAVHHDHRGRGLGGLLLTAGPATSARPAHAVFTHAVTGRGAAFLVRHGYRRIRDPHHLPDDGPSLWPMWRADQHGWAVRPVVRPGHRP